MKISLYLANNLVELDKDVSIPLNKTFDNLSNPTDIVVDYSKSINIPMTQANNKVLGNAYRLDRNILKGSNDNIGMYLDPSKKIPFRLMYNNDLILEGYAKFTSANYSQVSKYYTINLYSALGGAIQDLQSVVVSPDQLSEDQIESDGLKYVLNDPLSGRDLDRNYIKESWELASHDMRSIKDGKPSDMSDVNIIGFAPAHRGTYDDFENDKIDIGGSIISLEEYLTQKWIATYKSQHSGATDEEAENYVNALKPGEVIDNVTDYIMNEYRSQYLKPYIYVDKLFQMFQAKCEELTGYKLQLDPMWFRDDNIYWNRLCYMLNYAEKESQQNTSEIITNGTNNNGFTEINEKPYFSKTVFSAKSSSEYIKGSGTFMVEPFKIDFNGMHKITDSYYTGMSLTWNDYTTFNIKVSIYNNNGSRQLVHEKQFWLAPDWRQTQLGDAPVPNIPGASRETQLKPYDSYKTMEDYGITHKCNFGFSVNIPAIEFEGEITDDFEIEVTGQFYFPTATPYIENGPLSAIYYSGAVGQNHYAAVNITDDPANYITVSPIAVSTNWVNSLKVKLSNFYKSDDPIFNVLVKYTKMFGLIWDIDYINREIWIKTRKTYFGDYTISSWGDKLNKGKDYTITPITFDSKYVKFNYEETDGYNYGSYQKRYNTAYGGKKMQTNYEFDTASEDLFEGIDPSCVSNRSIISFDRIYNWNLSSTLLSEIENEVKIDDDDEEASKSLDLNNWFFRLDNVDISGVRITDDSDTQANNKISCWEADSYNEYTVRPSKYPIFSIALPGEKGGLKVDPKTWEQTTNIHPDHTTYKSTNKSGHSVINMKIKGYDSVELKYKASNFKGGDFLAICQPGLDMSEVSTSQIIQWKNDYMAGNTAMFNSKFIANTLNNYNGTANFDTTVFEGMVIKACDASRYTASDGTHDEYRIVTNKKFLCSTDGKQWNVLYTFEPELDGGVIIKGPRILAINRNGFGHYSTDGGKTWKTNYNYPNGYDYMIYTDYFKCLMFSSTETKQPKSLNSISSTVSEDIFTPVQIVSGIVLNQSTKYINVMIGPNKAYYGSRSDELISKGYIGRNLKMIAQAYVPGVSSSTGRFVTVGNPEDFYYSDDGQNWTKLNYNGRAMNRVRTDGEGFIGFGNDGYVHRSADGIDWTDEFTGLDTNIFDIMYNSNIGVEIYIGDSENGMTISTKHSQVDDWGTINIPISDKSADTLIQAIYCVDVNSPHTPLNEGYVAIPNLPETPPTYADGLTFTTPMRDYTKDKLVSLTLNRCLFDKYWKDYIDERYNIQNKKLTAYFKLSPADYLNFKFSNFVYVDNQLFHVNKIYDFNLNNPDFTKCDLLQITDIAKYATNTSEKAGLVFNVNVTGPTIEINGLKIRGLSYMGYKGDVIKYKVMKSGYEPIEGIFELGSKDNIVVTLENV